MEGQLKLKIEPSAYKKDRYILYKCHKLIYSYCVYLSNNFNEI